MILITGCLGYIGKRLAELLLKSGVKVRGLVLPGKASGLNYLRSLGLDIWRGDLLAPHTLKGIATGVAGVYHLAGLHSSSVRKMEDLYVGGTQVLMDCFAKQPPEYFIIASNGAVYGDYGDAFVTESDPPKPGHPFGELSLKMETAALGAYQTNAFPAIIFRIAEVYGPDEYNYLKVLRNGPVSLLGDGSNWQSRIHIADLLAILAQSPQYLKPGSIYNVGDNFPVRQGDFYQYLERKFAIPAPQRLALKTAPERIRLSIHGLRALSIRLSNQAIINDLKYEFQYPSFREGTGSLL
jgi:nucleoside-diphosphate-sugar epimerase